MSADGIEEEKGPGDVRFKSELIYRGVFAVSGKEKGIEGK